MAQDLIDKIKNSLNGIGLISPTFDIHYENEDNIFGFVSDESFVNKDDDESQKLIWNALKRNLGAEELIKILAIFHETPQERVERLAPYRIKNLNHSNFWLHETPDFTKYWLFIDVGKFGDDFKSFYLIINQKSNFNKGLTFLYNKDVIDFMELEQEDLYSELYNNTFNSAEADIKSHIMSKYDRLSDKGLYGNSNIFKYVFTSFKLKPVTKKDLIFSPKEIKAIKNAIIKIDKFKTIEDIEGALKTSEIINNLKTTFLETKAKTA